MNDSTGEDLKENGDNDDAEDELLQDLSVRKRGDPPFIKN